MATVAASRTSRRFLRFILILAGLSIALVAVSVYFSFAKATVTLYPREEPVSTDFTASIDPSKATDTASLDLVPGRIERTTKQGSKEITQVDQKLVEDFAHVTVTIFNEQSGSQGLLPRTQLVTEDGIKFRTDEAVTVPGGGSVQVGATADEKGVTYNIPPSTFSIIKLSPELQQLVYATSAEAATGGERPTTAVTEEDITAAQDALAEELKAAAQAELSGKLSGTEQFIPEAVVVRVTEQSSSVEPGEQVPSFSVDVTVEAATVFFDEDGLLQLAIAKLNESLPEDRELVSYDPATFTYSESSFDAEKGTAKLAAALAGVARPRLPQEAFDRNPLKGRSRAEVADHFKQFEQIDHVDVAFAPFFAFVVPTIIDNISIEVGKSPSAEAQTAAPTAAE